MDLVPYREQPKYNDKRRSALPHARHSRVQPPGGILPVSTERTNLLRLKSLSASSPQLLDSDTSTAEPSKRRRQRPEISKKNTGILHAVGVPTITENGQVTLKFVESSRSTYESDSPYADDDDNSSMGYYFYAVDFRQLHQR